MAVSSNVSALQDPKVIFADEPTGNLDSKTTIEILEYLQHIVAEDHKTLIMVSHDLEVAMYADRIVHMLDGKVLSIEDNRTNRIASKEGNEANE